MNNSKKDLGGLKKMRAQSAKEPKYSCDNCGCMRYSPCKCTRKDAKKDE